MNVEVKDTKEEELGFEGKGLRVRLGWKEDWMGKGWVIEAHLHGERGRVNSFSHADLMLSSVLSQGVSWSPTSSCSS